MTVTLAFTDGETSGLDSGFGQDPEADRMWELAVKVRGHREPGLDGMWVWQLNVQGTAVAPAAAEVNRFYERYVVPPDVQVLMMRQPSLDVVPDDLARGTYAELAQTLMRLLSGAHMVGAVTDFDTRFLLPFLHEHYGPSVRWSSAPWHYHLVDVENLAAGRLQIPPPWDSEQLSHRLGVTAAPWERHTAEGDAAWAERMYDAVFALQDVESFTVRTADGRQVPVAGCCQQSEYGTAAANL